MGGLLRLLAAGAGSGPAQHLIVKFHTYFALDPGKTGRRVNDQCEESNEAYANENLCGFRH
jgi:hypothetical protein